MEYAYCIRTALLIKTIAMEASPYATADNKLRENKISVMEAIIYPSIFTIFKSKIQRSNANTQVVIEAV